MPTDLHHADIQQCIAQQPKSVLLIHHWDTDGLASAALMQQYISDHSAESTVTLYHPTINLYFLTDAQYQWIEQHRFDLIICVDLNFPPDVFERLHTMSPHLFVFDHHVQTEELHLPGAQDASYPGASQLIADQLLLPISVTSVLGMIGDQEDALQQWEKFYPMVEQVIKETGITFDALHRLAKLLDTMYIVGDDEGLAYAVGLLRGNPQDAAHDQRLLDAELKISSEKNAALSQEMEDVSCGTSTKIFFQEIEAQANIISEVTRARAKQFPNDVIMTTHHIGSDFANVYVRTRRQDIDLTPLVTFARKQGFNAGGKKEVVGTILPQEQLEEYVDGLTGEVMKLLPN